MNNWFERLLTLCDTRCASALGWLGVLSLLSAALGALWLPRWLAALPPEFFLLDPPPATSPRARCRRLAANIGGGALVLVGAVMLVLPGQGILCIVCGLALMHFPGKRALVLRLVRRPAVAKLLNWMRDARGAPPFTL